MCFQLLVSYLIVNLIIKIEIESSILLITYRLVGDVLLATGFLSYCGPYNQEFRARLIKCWMRILKSHSIPFTENLNITSMLVETATVRTLNWFSLDVSNSDGTIFSKDGEILTFWKRFFFSETEIQKALLIIFLVKKATNTPKWDLKVKNMIFLLYFLDSSTAPRKF